MNICDTAPSLPFLAACCQLTTYCRSSHRKVMLAQWVKFTGSFTACHVHFFHYFGAERCLIALPFSHPHEWKRLTHSSSLLPVLPALHILSASAALRTGLLMSSAAATTLPALKVGKRRKGGFLDQMLTIRSVSSPSTLGIKQWGR